MKALRFFLVLVVITGLTQCKKTDDKNGPDPIKPMTELNVPDGFNWQMAHTVNFHVSGIPGTVVKITTADATITLHKSTILPGNTPTDIAVSIPYFIQEVKVNGIQVPITGEDIDVTIPQPKDLLLTNYNLVFDGTDDFVNLGDITQLNGVAAFTVEGWAKQTTNTDGEYIFSKADGVTDDIRVRTAAGTMYIEVGNGSDDFAEWAAYSATIASGTWFHWAVVFDGAGVANADRLKLYINGSVTPIVLTFTGTIPATTSAALSGDNAFLSTAASPFGGKMDEVRIWSVARTSVQINSYYDKLVSGASANLVANWRMNEGTGTTAYDETSNNWDGALSGCTWSQEISGFDTDEDGITDDNDDYEFDDTRAFDNFLPATAYGTLVFEDIWPNYGDYDFNDLVLGYRFKTVTNASNDVVEIFATFIVRANGANMHNGFGFELPDAVAGILTNVEVTGYSLTQGIITIDGTTHLESGQSNPVVIAFDDTYDLMAGIYNTVTGGASASTDSVVIYMEVTGGGPFDEADFSLDTWNPFIFINQTRGRELHLLDYTPTDLMTTAYFGTGNDASVPASGDYYKSANDLPWGLNFPVSFSYASEFNAINTAYLHFTAWAESGGTLYTDWYSNTAGGYRNTTYIYVP